MRDPEIILFWNLISGQGFQTPVSKGLSKGRPN